MTIIRIRFYSFSTAEKFFEWLSDDWNKVKNIKVRQLMLHTCNHQIKLYFDIPFEEAYNLTGNYLQKAVNYYSYPYEMKVLKKGK